MLRFGIRGHDMPKEPLEDLVKHMSELGFCCTQLALQKAIWEFPTNRQALTPGMAMYLKQLFASYGVDIAVLGCYLNLGMPIPEQLEEIQKTYEAHIRFASLLGCGMVGTETGAVNIEYEEDPNNQTEEALNLFIKNLSRVVTYAEKMGVLIGIEPVCRHIMYDNKRTRKVLDAINSPNLQIIFDPVNLLNLQNYKQQNEIIEEAFDLYLEEIAVIHLKDFIIKDNKLITSPLALGQGQFNLDFLLKKIKKQKPFIHVLLEDSIPENALISKKYIQKRYQEV